MKYAIAIAGFNTELIIKPFLRMLDPLDALILLVTQNEKSIETAKEVERFLAFANVKCELVDVSNIYNFFEVLVVLENLAELRGKPLWLNVSAGPGIAISALTYFAILHESDVVFYNRESDKTSRVEIAKSKDLFKKARKNLKLLSLLKNSTLSLDNLASMLKLSKSTISRRVRVLKSAYLVETKYLDKKMFVYISETGLKLLGTKRIMY